MGQKVNPTIFRTGVIKTWPSKWFASKKSYIANLKDDVNVRKYIVKEMREAGVDKVEISRNGDKIIIDIHVGKPGVVIGRGGQGAETLKKNIRKFFLKTTRLNNININIIEVSRPSLSAQIVAQQMAIEIEKRMPFRKVMKQALSRMERGGAIGAKVLIKGRLNGAEIAREEKLAYGKVPLHTLRANIDYASYAAHTTYGTIGLKVWINKGELFGKEDGEKGDVVGREGSK